MYFNHRTTKDCVGFHVFLLILRSKLSLMLALRHLEHVHGS
jgi:hypothetical protein